MSFLRKSILFATSLLFGSLLLSVPVASYADLSMKPRTCSNCSGFSGNSSSYPHRPSMGISGHKSFGNQNFKSSGRKPTTVSNIPVNAIISGINLIIGITGQDLTTTVIITALTVAITTMVLV